MLEGTDKKSNSTITVNIDNDLKQLDLNVNSVPFYSDEIMAHLARAIEQFKTRSGK